MTLYGPGELITGQSAIAGLVRTLNQLVENLIAAGTDPAAGSVTDAAVAADAAIAQSKIAGLIDDLAGRASDAELAALAASTTSALAASATLKTVRITVPFSGNGLVPTSAGLITDWSQRLLMALPVATTRWRIRARNFSAYHEGLGNPAAGAGTVTVAGVWKGAPSFSGTRWAGVFAAAPSQVLTSFALAAAGASDTASPWVTDPAHQFAAGEVAGLSVGLTADGSNTFFYDNSAAVLYRSGAGTAAAAGDAAFTVDSVNLGTLDLRLEYEAAVPSSTKVTLVCADSIAQGSSGGDDGAYPHESWPGAYALRSGEPVVNLGAAATLLSQWAAGPGWKIGRADLATTVPDRAIIALGTNDLSGGSLVNFTSQLTTLIAYLRDVVGIKDVRVATIIPYVGGLGNETNRGLFNGLLRSMPRGVTRVIDFDAVIRVPAAPTTADPTFLTTYPHPLRAGHQRMASAVA